MNRLLARFFMVAITTSLATVCMFMSWPAYTRVADPLAEVRAAENAEGVEALASVFMYEFEERHLFGNGILAAERVRLIEIMSEYCEIVPGSCEGNVDDGSANPSAGVKISGVSPIDPCKEGDSAFLCKIKRAQKALGLWCAILGEFPGGGTLCEGLYGGPGGPMEELEDLRRGEEERKEREKEGREAKLAEAKAFCAQVEAQGGKCEIIENQDGTISLTFERPREMSEGPHGGLTVGFLLFFYNFVSGGNVWTDGDDSATPLNQDQLCTELGQC